jgi:hypothetical protein
MYSKTDAVLHEERTDKWEAEPNALEIRYERYRGILKNLTLMSDVFMRNVFKEHACTEYVLQVIMGRKDLRFSLPAMMCWDMVFRFIILRDGSKRQIQPFGTKRILSM